MERAGASSVEAARQATGTMYRQLMQQATQLAYLDALWVLGVMGALMVPIIFLTKRPGPMGAAAAH
jgi:DHA2 family multidrug resistance protein